MLINKEDLGIVGLILDEIEFRFWGCWVDFLLIFVMFDDMRCDKGFGEGELGFWLILLGKLGSLMVKF